jgi:hypothetical protein
MFAKKNAARQEAISEEEIAEEGVAEEDEDSGDGDDAARPGKRRRKASKKMGELRRHKAQEAKKRALNASKLFVRQCWEENRAATAEDIWKNKSDWAGGWNMSTVRSILDELSDVQKKKQEREEKQREQMEQKQRQVPPPPKDPLCAAIKSMWGFDSTIGNQIQKFIRNAFGGNGQLHKPSNMTEPEFRSALGMLCKNLRELTGLNDPVQAQINTLREKLLRASKSPFLPAQTDEEGTTGSTAKIGFYYPTAVEEAAVVAGPSCPPPTGLDRFVQEMVDDLNKKWGVDVSNPGSIGDFINQAFIVDRKTKTHKAKMPEYYWDHTEVKRLTPDRYLEALQSFKRIVVDLGKGMSPDCQKPLALLMRILDSCLQRGTGEIYVGTKAKGKGPAIDPEKGIPGVYFRVEVGDG